MDAAEDHDAIQSAVLDYVEGWFDGDADRMRRALHPELVKRCRGIESDNPDVLETLSAGEMIEATAKGVGRGEDAADRQIEIEIAYAAGGIASVTCRCHRYVDLLHLILMPDGWKIVNSAWSPALSETAATSPPGGGQTRARHPDREGILARGGVRIRWESYGRGTPTILLLPAWSIIHSRCWTMQIPELARRHRVLTVDPRGNGGSDRPTDPAAYAEEEFAADALALMDATDAEDVVVVALSLGAQRALILAGEHPARVRGLVLVLVGPLFNLERPLGQERQAAVEFDTDSGADDGWGRYNAHSWRRDYPGFVEFFFGEVFSEPHSTKQIEDCVGWGLETDAETLIAAEVPGLEAARARELCARVRCPVLVVHGDKDAIVPHEVGVEAAALTGGRLVTLQGSGHCPQARDPVRFNVLLRKFVGSLRVPAGGGK